MNSSELALLDLVPTPIYILDVSSDENLIYSYLNEAALDFSNFSLSDIIGLSATSLFDGDLGELVSQKHKECYRLAQPTAYVLQLPLNGKLRTVKTRLMPILNTEGYVTQIIGASADITAERDLDQFRESSRGIENELQEFVYLAAHDLRSPMKKVQAFSDILREDFKDMGDGKLELIDMIEKISIDSLSMIERLLRHAETIGIKSSIEDFHLMDVTDRILAQLDPQEHHRWRADDCSIRGDVILVETFLRNLVDNALKHNSPNAVTLDVSAKNIKRGYITITITDNGKGVYAPENLFSQHEGVRSKSGFGLLAIRKLIKRAGGDIRAELPDSGEGLAVSVTLPGKIQAR